MAKVKFDELIAPIKYYPVVFGDAEMQLVEEVSMPPSKLPNTKIFLLYHKGLQWCAYNVNSRQEIKDQFVEINLARGKVVTTGLGFGLIHSFLLQKKEVSELIVYEKNVDIVNMFKYFAAESNFDISKLKIIHEDANNLKDIKCDWLLMDHFEGVHQPDWEIIDTVRMIAANNKAKNVLFWPMFRFYKTFCVMKDLKLSNESYALFTKMLNVKNLLNSLDEEYFPKIDSLFKMKVNNRKIAKY